MEANKNKPKVVTPSPDLNGTDRAAGEVSTKEDRWNQIIQQAVQENNSKNEHARFLEVNQKGITELQNFVVQRNFLKEAQPLVEQINFGYDAAEEMGRALLHNVRATGVLLHQWKDAVGHGNWVDAYESSGFHKSIDTARNWMRLSLMTDAEIAEVTSVREALVLLKDEKKRKKGKGGNPNPRMDDDDEDEDGNSDGAWVGKLMQATMPPKPEIDPELKKQAREKIRNALKWLGKPKTKKDVDFWALDLEGAEGTVIGDFSKLVDYIKGDIGRDVFLGKPEPEFELTLIDELEMVMKRVCAEHPREEVARMVASMLNDYYQPKEETVTP